MNPNRNWILNPSDFAFFWEECKRCFYLKVATKFPRPRSPMPRIFGLRDAQMREFYSGKQTRDAMPFLPPGTIDTSASRVQSAAISVPGHSSNCTIKGKRDTLVRFNDNTYGIVDFKTSGPRSEHKMLNSRQLHRYALALENAAPGNLLLSPVTKLGLIVFEPSAFLKSRSYSASLTGDVNWVEIPRNDSQFLAFLDEVLSILELPNPPRSFPTCQWCQYQNTSRVTKL
jgi:PD-(D/E)XK nuclease superfamily